MSKPSFSTKFSVGPAAKRELRKALKNAEDPQATIQAFQRDHSLHTMMARAFGTTPEHEAAAENRSSVVEPLESDSVLSFLNHLGVSQYDVHKRVSDTLLKQLEDCVRNTPGGDKQLLDLLSNCWSYSTTVPELRPVVWAVLKQLGDRTPTTVLLRLTERKPDGSLKHAELFDPLPPNLHRLCWQADWKSRIREGVETTLLYKTLHPHIQAYCSNERLVKAADLLFVSTIRERRVPTQQRRALTAISSPSSTHKTVVAGAPFLRRAETKVESWSSGKDVAEIRSVLNDSSGSASVCSPSLLYGLMVILLQDHAATNAGLGGASRLRCTLVADILLAAGGTLPKPYQDLLKLVRELDEIVQLGNLTDEALAKVQECVKSIFQDNDDPIVNEYVNENETDATPSEAQTSSSGPLQGLIASGLDAMKKADPRSLFLNPVTNEIAHGYSKIIRKPMCITMMEEKNAKNMYSSLDLWQADVRLMFQNCIDYNKGNAGQWFRGEANRQSRVFKDEIFNQIKVLYATEVAPKERKRSADTNSVNISPLLASCKRRKKVIDEEAPSIPGLASMVLSDPFVVRVLLARVLRDLQKNVLPGGFLPVGHTTIPSVLQLLHLARYSNVMCATDGQTYFVPPSGALSYPDNTDDSRQAIPFSTVRSYAPLILRLLVEIDLDQRVAVNGELHGALSAVDNKMETLAPSAWSAQEGNEVTVTIMKGFLVQLVFHHRLNDESFCDAFRKLSQALTLLNEDLVVDEVFFKCLLAAILQQKNKVSKSCRDVVVDTWLGWLERSKSSLIAPGHSIFLDLLNEWSAMGNMVMPCDHLATVISKVADIAGVLEMWSKEEFSTIKTKYDHLLTLLPEEHAEEWKKLIEKPKE